MAEQETPEDTSVLPDRALQSALEFAVLIAAAGQKTRPPVPFPAGLKPFLRFHKLPPKALSTVRDVVEGDPEYLHLLAIGAQAELVDEVGMLWLTRPEGWLDTAVAAVQPDVEVDDASDARAERRRREAAETAAARSRLEVVELKELLTRARLDAVDLAKERDRLAKQLRAAESRVGELERGARRREAGNSADAERADAAVDELRSLRDRLTAAEEARDAALSSRAEESATVDADRMRTLLLEALALTGTVPEPARRPRRAVARKPIPIPGGLYGHSEKAAEHLLRFPGVLVLVDGYNVAKLGWPERSLEQQRDRCIDAAEALARRWGTALHIVFDGADVVGAHTRGRRLVRVTFSPEGVLADDVLRAEVAAVEPSRAVVVVTNDQAVLQDVKAAGANTISSDAFLTLARR
ncbi:MAG: hypothetical protein RJA49_991 [Actinomycetota bacterium]